MMASHWRSWVAGLALVVVGCAKDVPPPPTGVDADLRLQEELQKARRSEGGSKTPG